MKMYKIFRFVVIILEFLENLFYFKFFNTPFEMKDINFPHIWCTFYHSGQCSIQINETALQI